MAAVGLINPSPVVYGRKETRRSEVVASSRDDENAREPIDSLEVFEHIRDITDPEHPYSLEQLRVVNEDQIDVDDSSGHVRVSFTPTVEHCNMATLIGLCIRVKLLRCLPQRFKVDIQVLRGSHGSINQC
ncbi:unnamed protein product [Ostreobium quekettii]|uniref:MIP18 family-like domain-containing protein n=1 Tax=Ostreobium quekettii TaxID=121088 RepID=A0A8S1JDB4_9CHLO|nr:unnamed protein product [Ostreobium quekettii]